MTNNHQYGGGKQDNGPPGQNLLCICLALVAAILGTPALFEWIGPIVERLIYKAYGSQDLADVMYFASFVLCGVVIFSISRMALWYAITAIIAFITLRFGNMLPMAGL